MIAASRISAHVSEECDEEHHGGRDEQRPEAPGERSREARARAARARSGSRAGAGRPSPRRAADRAPSPCPAASRASASAGSASSDRNAQGKRVMSPAPAPVKPAPPLSGRPPSSLRPQGTGGLAVHPPALAREDHAAQPRAPTAAAAGRAPPRAARDAWRRSATSAATFSPNIRPPCVAPPTWTTSASGRNQIFQPASVEAVEPVGLLAEHEEVLVEEPDRRRPPRGARGSTGPSPTRSDAPRRGRSRPRSTSSARCDRGASLRRKKYSVATRQGVGNPRTERWSVPSGLRSRGPTTAASGRSSANATSRSTASPTTHASELISR